MSSTVLKPGQSVPATIDFKDAGGNAAQPAAPPVWTSDNTSAATVQAAADGMSGVTTYVGPGVANINIVAEGDATPGVDTVKLTGSVQCIAGEIATGEIVFGAPSP